MAVNLHGRNFITLKDFTPDEIHYLLNLASDLKAKKRAGIKGDLLERKISYYYLKKLVQELDVHLKLLVWTKVAKLHS